jgi:hypothetical protein
MTGNARRFLVFKDWQSSIDMLAFYVARRGIYVGGNANELAGLNPVGPARIIKQPGEQVGELMHIDLFTAYLRAWVLGDITAKPNLKEVRDFTGLYNQAAKIFF